jgi:hypothetical protein
MDLQSLCIQSTVSHLLHWNQSGQDGEAYSRFCSSLHALPSEFRVKLLKAAAATLWLADEHLR